ncbi:MAG: class I SAM-dependent methyltransferase [Synergistaceae bacterium]|jgi:SAM-dependent methyltransferase|nr:class I SAM-dependent methyltransferase [Synergistaceae bacterium]
MIEMSKLQDLVERNWTESAERYDGFVERDLNGPKRDAWRSLILSNAPEKKNDRLKVLDIGTGPGFFPIILASADVEVSAIDCTKEMVRIAERNVAKAEKQADIRIMDSHSLDFPDGKFDLVVSRNVAWTLSDPERAYGEWARVLRPGGRILIFDANWQRHYHDEEARRRFEEHDKKYFARTGEHLEDFIQQTADPKTAGDLRSSTPLGKFQRPQWDFDILLKLDLRRFHFDLRVGEEVWTPEEQFRYLYAPMFMVMGER